MRLFPVRGPQGSPAGKQAVAAYRPIQNTTEDRGMKHLLNGVAIAAVIAIAAPAWAQTVPGQPSLQQGMPKAGTASPSAGAPSNAAPMAPAAAAPMAPGTTATGQPNRTMGMPKAHHASASNKSRHHVPRRAVASSADQLNAQELTTLQGGGAPPPMPGSGVPGQPSLQTGMPKAGTPSPSAPTP